MHFNNEVITSRNNNLVKWAASLQDKKGREASSSFMVEGIKLSCEAIEAGLPVTHIFIDESKKEVVLEKLNNILADKEECTFEVCFVSTSVFEKISTEKAPQGIITVIKYLDFFEYADIIYKEDFFVKKGERAVILCSVRDPLNLGAIVRSSVAFGVDRIILTDDCADIYNPKTLRSAMGSLFRVKVTVVKSLDGLINAFQYNSRRVFAAELTENAISLKDAALTSDDVVIIGNEGHGIPREISEICDGSVYIPISKKTESLNASVAAAIFMWEQSK